MLVERDHDWRALGLAHVFDPCVHDLAERVKFRLCGCFSSHSQKAARLDLQKLRHVTAPGARVVVDDINVDPGHALKR